MNRSSFLALALLCAVATGCAGLSDDGDDAVTGSSPHTGPESQPLHPAGTFAPRGVQAPAARPTRCAQGPNLVSVTAVLRGAGAIEVEASGETCNTEITDFGFQVYNADGNNITGRSWPELGTIETKQGQFILRGDAAGCSDYAGATHLEVTVRGSELNSNTLRVAVDRAQAGQ